MDSCDRRVRAYKNGKTMDQCKEIAESMNPDFKIFKLKHPWKSSMDVKY